MVDHRHRPSSSLGEATEGRERLLALYAAALRAVDGRAAVSRALRARPLAGPVWLVALGKAAESMTLGAFDVLGGRCAGGLLIGREAPSCPGPLVDHGVAWLVGDHPVPGEASLACGERLIRQLAAIPAEASLLFLISGGTSSLVEVPVAGVGLDALQRVNRWLLGSGLPIRDMNRVRTALSQIKGGGLLGLLPRRPLRALAVSDVPADDPAVIGSGLLVPTPDLAESLAGLALAPWLRDWIAVGLAGRPPVPKEGPGIELVARLEDAKEAVARAARTLSLPVRAHRTFLDGEASERGRELARAVQDGPPGLQVWGGETTVRLPPNPGRGGRSQQLALAAALELAGRSDCLLLAAGTDGSDGSTEDAGALVDGGTLERGTLGGLDPRDCLARADAGRFLAASGDLIHTGSTGTNVMDLVLGLKLAP